MKISFTDIQKAKQRISHLLKETPITRSSYFSKKLGLHVFFKWENEQKIKSFKIRGALNKILSLTEKERNKGLITASAGNHAQGVALGAQYLKIKARVVMMEKASKVKVSATKKLGAEVILKGKNYDESYKYAQTIKRDSTFIHPFADSQIIAGQGTIGLEILKSLPQIQSLIVPVGGGGLLSGVSLAIKKIKPSLKIYGVVWEGTPDFCKSFHKIKKDSFCSCKQLSFSLTKSQSGLTDGIAVKKSFQSLTTMCSKYVDEIGCVSEKDISKCIIDMNKWERKSLEGSGVAALAGLLKYSNFWNLGRHVCVLVSGANIDSLILSKILTRRLFK